MRTIPRVGRFFMVNIALIVAMLVMGLYPAEAETPDVVSYSEIREVKQVWVTAYSSTPEETDDTPFITASGNSVRHGIVAANFLPLGTKVQIPEFFGDTIFEVDDRMHSRKTNFVDVWMPTKEDARRFGIAYTEILVLDDGKLMAVEYSNDK